MADGGGTPWTLALIIIVGFQVVPQMLESNEYLKSIDEKMHTHAADGSINGIGGWY